MVVQELTYLTNKVADLIIEARRSVVFTGAGVSTESGIPDFRSPGGIWSKCNPDEFTYQKFVSDSEARKKHWQMLTSGGLTKEAEPNAAHYAIAELEELGKLDCVITQNVDNLHQKAGNSGNKVLELHGNMRRVVCLKCHRQFAVGEILYRLKQGEEAPNCPDCHGILKPDAVLFGEALPQETLREAVHHARNCDLFIVIGSTLVIYPAAYMPIYAKEAGAKLVIINLSSTPLDQQATVLIREKAGEVMGRVMEKVRDKLKMAT